MRTPVAPMGWPRAMAPPLTLIFSGSKRELAVAGQDLGREGLVDLHEVEVLQAEPRLLEQAAHGGDDADAHHVGVDAGGGRRRARLRHRPHAQLRGAIRAQHDRGPPRRR